MFFRSTPARVASPLRSISFWLMIVTGDAVTGMRLALTRCGIKEPVITVFSTESDFFAAFTSLLASDLGDAASAARRAPESRNKPASNGTKGSSGLLRKRQPRLELRWGVFMA